DDFPAVRRNVKASDRIPWLQIGELPALPRLQIDDPEILFEITAEQHDELPATRQKTVTIASSRYYYLGESVAAAALVSSPSLRIPVPPTVRHRGSGCRLVTRPASSRIRPRAEQVLRRRLALCTPGYRRLRMPQRR